MTWNYRVIRTESAQGTNYAIHEVFYGADGSPESWTADPVGVVAEERQGLLLDLAVMAKAVLMPVLQVNGEKLIEVEAAIDMPNDPRGLVT